MINSNSQNIIGRVSFALACLALVTFVGCGGRGGKQKDEFFTSGSREADQRATQRMAKEEQLAGQPSGEKSSANTPTGRTDAKSAEEQARLTLFERLGGEEGITAVVDDFVPRALADPRVNWERRGGKSGGVFRRNRTESVAWEPNEQNVGTLKKHLVQFIALATGGPAQYDGKDIKAAHAGLGISNPEFDAVIGDLKASLDKLRIGTKEQKELLAIVESTRPQIVTER